MISGFTQITPTDARVTSTTKNGVLLGTYGVTRDGKIYRWTQAGAVNLAAGKINVTPPHTANHTNLAVPSTSQTAVNSTKISVTLGGTAVTADQYLDGSAVVNDGTGIGGSYLIAGNSAQTSGSGVADIYLAEGLSIAISSSDTKVTLQPSKFSGAIIAPGAVTHIVNGVANVAVAASSFYWSQTRGIASVLSDGVIGKASGSIVSDAVNGAVEVEVAGTVTQRVGYAPDATVDAKYYPQFLTID